MILKNEAQLREVYAQPKGRAKIKELDYLDKHAIHFIENSPFIVVSSASDSGIMDASPRGGEPGFVKVSNDRELIIPDFKGNNRINSLTNIVETNGIGLLFMIPGIDETLRVNGYALIETAPKMLNKLSNGNKYPISCIVVNVKEVFLHCAKAFMRSKLWDINSQIDPADFPTMGEMLRDQLGSSEEPETREAMTNRYLEDI